METMKKDKLLETILRKYHKGNVSDMAKELGIGRSTLSNYLHRIRVYNKDFVTLIRGKYGRRVRSNGIPDAALLNLLGDKK